MKKFIPKRSTFIIGITIIFMIVFCMETIGYGLYHKIIDISGDLTFNHVDIIQTDNIMKTDSSNVISDYITDTYTTITYEISYSASGYVEYMFDIKNDTNEEQEFVDVINDGYLTYSLSNLSIGDKIAPGETKTCSIRLSSDAVGVFLGSVELQFVTENNGTLMGAFSGNTTGNLNTNTIVPFTVSVMNTYSYPKEFNLTISNSNFKIVNNDYSDYGKQTIGANETKDYTFYLIVSNTAIFESDSESLSVVLESNGLAPSTVGSLTLQVKKTNISTNDKQAPVISTVRVTQGTTEGTATVTWNATDASSIRNYTIVVNSYANNRYTTIQTNTTIADEKTFTLTNLPDGVYQIKVYGQDVLGNTATNNNINQCSTNQGACAMTSNTTIKWNFTVTNNFSNCSGNGAATVKYGQTYTATITASNNYTLPNTITVNMGGTNVNANNYSWNSSTGVFSINNVTGDLRITVSANRNTCLMAGTKVLLANDIYKNIEDVTYNDLLKVWNYDTGDYTYEYPIWIEKTKTTDSYQRTTFSDGSILETNGFHGVFNYDTLSFISVDNPEFKVGTRIAKILNGKIIPITVQKIEYINENKNYYHVVSTRYYNIIANNILTTDGTVQLSNLYGFDQNIKWLNHSNQNYYSYDDFKDIMPYYMFYGMRVREAAALANILPLDIFKEYLLNNQLNKDMYLAPPTSIIATIDNKKYSVKNNKLTLPKSGKCYLSSTDNICYEPGSEVEVYSNTYYTKIK